MENLPTSSCVLPQSISGDCDILGGSNLLKFNIFSKGPVEKIDGSEAVIETELGKLMKFDLTTFKEVA